MSIQPRCRVTWMVLLGLIGSVLVWSPSVLAQEKAKRREACMADVQKFCPHAKTAQEQVQCLKSHEAGLSQGCRDLQAKAVQTRTKIAQVREACQDDAETLCRDVKPGRGGLLQCLRAHEAELSVACKNALPRGKGN